MSTEYIKTNWQDGDIITADKMNNIENGIKDVEGVATSLKEDITTIRKVVPGANLCDYSNHVVGAIQADGTVATNGVWGDQLCGDFFEIEGGKTYYYEQFVNGVTANNRKNYLFYDSEKQPITSSYGSATDHITTITAPSNAVYCRISWYKICNPVFSASQTPEFIPYEEYYVNKLLLEVDGQNVTADQLSESLVQKEYKQSKNLIDPSVLAVGKFMDAGGGLADNANYSTTGFIPVIAGQKITVSPRLRASLFFDSSKNAITASYNNTYTGNPGTFTASVDGYFRASVFTEDTSFVQAEYGENVTPYTPYEITTVAEHDVHLSEAMTDDVMDIINSVNNGTLFVSINGNNMIVSETINNKVLERTYLITGRNNNVFNFDRASLDSTRIKWCSDDITPQRMKYYDNGTVAQWTVGANHGWMCYRVPKGSLAQADCGSVWTDGVRNYTLMVVDSSYAYFAYPILERVGDYFNVAYGTPAGNLSHVSGATHTDTVSISGGLNDQFWPAINHRSVKIIANGEEITGSTSFATNNLKVYEHYEIMDYADMVSVMQNNVGSALDDIKDSVDSMLALDYVYEIVSGSEIIYTTATALSEAGLVNSGFMQAEILDAVGGSVYRYANGIKDSNAFASSSLHDMTNYSDNVQIKPSDMIDANKPTNRVVDLCMSAGQILYGFTIGFIPDMSYGSDAKRKDLSTIWDMRSSKKIYPWCVADKTLASGESVGVIGYRHYIIPSQDMTNKTAVDIADKKYVFLDAHEPVSSSVDGIGIGNDVSVIDSSGMTVQEFVGATGVPFNSSAEYSCAVLKVK